MIRRPQWSPPTRFTGHATAWQVSLALVLVLALTPALAPALHLSGTAAGSGGAGSPILMVRAKGSTGQERFEVREAGTVLATLTAGTDWQDFTVATPSPAGAPDVEVAFVNDGSDPADRNLSVDSVTYAGQTYQAEAAATFSTGVWDNGGRCRPGYFRSEILACNGSLSFGTLAGPAPVDHDPSRPGSVIELSAAGATGNELAEIRVDGRAVMVFRVAASPDLYLDAGLTHYLYHHPDPVRPDQLTVAFVNDRYEPGVDYNLRLRSASIDGSAVPATATVLDGAAATAALCRSQVLPREILACNGQVSFTPILAQGSAGPTTTTSAVTQPPTTTTTAGPRPTVRPVTPSSSGPSTTQPVVAAPSTKPSTATATTTTRPTVAATAPSTAPGPVGGGTGPGAASGRFYVVGSDIVGPDGRIFYPIGANVAIKFTPYGYVFEGNNGGVNDHLDAVKAWNWNTIRATLICDNSSGTPSFAQLVDGIAPTIDRFTKAGIVVILECHDSTGKDPRLGTAKDLHIQRFWDEMARRYKSNPYVWFNIYNEPYASADGVNWAKLHQAYVDRIRAAGAENIIVADLPNYSQGIDLVANQSFADRLSRSCNTVFGWHAYGAIAGRQGTLADHEAAIVKAQQKGMALLVGEMGVATPANWGNAGPWQWNITGFDAVSVLGPRYGIGTLWWHATGDDAYFSLYALKNDRSGFWTAASSGNLTPYGQRFWDLSHRVPHDLGPFHGSLAASGCPSAGR